MRFDEVFLDEVMAVSERYANRHRGWNVNHFYGWYRRDGGGRSFTWVKNTLQSRGLFCPGQADQDGEDAKFRQFTV